MSSSSSATLSDDATLVRTIAGYFEAVGKHALARSLRASLEAPQNPTTIALVGELGRGKTVLADALQRFYAGGGSGDGGAAGAAGAAGGGNGGAGIRPVGALDSFAFIDCPGFNGADSEVTRAAIALTRESGVVVFVLDATSTITSPELELLKEIALGSRGVVVALAKKDKNLLGWRAVEQANRRQIAQHIGDEIPVVSVSALRYLSAGQAGQAVRGAGAGAGAAADLAEAVAADSGIPRLAEMLEKCRVQQGAEASEEQITPTLVRALPLMAAELAEIRATIAAGIDDPTSATAYQKQLIEQLTTGRRRGQQLLSAGLNQARSRATTTFENELVEAREKWKDYFEKTSPRFIRAHSDAVFLQIEAEFGAIFEQAIRNLMALSREAYGAHAIGAVDWRAIVDALADVAFDVDASDAPAEGVSATQLVDPSLVSLTIAGGFSLSHVVGMVPGVGALVLGSGGTTLPFVALAGVWLGVNMYHRSKTINRSELTKWLDHLVLQTRRQVTHSIETVYNELRPLVINQFNDSIDSQISKAKRDLQQLMAGIQYGEDEQEEVLREAQQKASYLAKLIDQVRQRTEPHA